MIREPIFSAPHRHSHQARAAELVQTASWLEHRKADEDEASDSYRLQARGRGRWQVVAW